jgi:hypothetical protein
MTGRYLFICRQHSYINQGMKQIPGKWTLLLTVLILMVSCNSSDHKGKGENEFYTYSHDGDLCRIPMIEPYELISPACTDTNNWFFNLPFQTIELENQISEIRTIGIKDSLIVIYRQDYYKPIDGRECPDAWFVVDVAHKKDMVFTSENEYSAYLHANHVDTIILYRVGKVFKDFDEQDKLPTEWPVGKK